MTADSGTSPGTSATPAAPTAGAEATFGARLAAAGERFGRLCVGVDPHARLLHDWGLEDDVHGLAEFSARCVEAFAGRVGLVKPQVAFYERHGSAGLRVLEETLAGFREAGTLTLADAKRGDIGSTMAGYADAWLGQGSALRADAVTVSPYLGVGALAPAAEAAAEHHAGVFILAATSNPEAAEVQRTADPDGATLAQRVVEATERLAAAHPGATCGVVVGATLAEGPDLAGFSGPVLLPGVGAQGASIADAERVAGAAAGRAWPNVSRAILSAGPSVEALRAAVGEFSPASLET